MHLAALGNFLISLSIICGLFSFIFKSRFAFFSQLTSIILCSLALFTAFVISDFSVQNVVFYSSTQKPLIYKMAGLWTNSDSSLLFLLSLMSVMAIISSVTEKDEEFQISVSRIYSAITLMVTCYICFLANPFGIVPNPPKEGFGLNPVLQDEAVSIHPPLLYIGYVSYLVPFGYAASMLILRRAKMEYVKHIFLFSKIGLGSLSAGIALGSWWAYRELGWGGFWFFDPVENVSLMPWLMGLALHHCLILTTRRRGGFKSSILLSLVNFLLITFGIITVRSGSLASVHSFASNTSFGSYVIGIFALLVASVLLLCWFRIDPIARSIKMHRTSTLKEKHAEKITKYGVILFYLAAFSILLSIIYPVMFKVFSGIDVNMDAGYFHLIFLPLGFLISILALYSIFIDKSSYGFKITQPLANKNIAMNISHLGIVVMVGAIILNGIFNQNMEFIGKEGSSKNFPNNVKVTLQNIKYAKGPNYFRQIAEFWIDIDGKTTVLKPENRYYSIENALSAESDIYSYLTQDVYAVIGNIDENKKLYANIYIRPYMAFIWFGMFLTSLGIFVSLMRKK